MRFIINIIALAFSFLTIFSCGSTKVRNVLWQGELVTSPEQLNYISWQEGIQFYTLQDDSLFINFAGMEADERIFIFISLSNERDTIFTFFPAESRLIQVKEGKDISLKPSKADKDDTEYLAVFSSVLVGAASLTRIVLNIPLDTFIGGYLTPSDNPAQDQIDENEALKKSFLKTHTLFSQTSYSGFLIFHNEDEKLDISKPFKLAIELAGKTYSASGQLPPSK